MIKIENLYEVIKSILPNDLSFKFSYVDLATTTETTTKVTKNTNVIYFRSADDGIRDISGNRLQETYRLVFNIFTDKGESGVKSGLDYCRRVCESLDTIFNRTFNINGEEVFICDCKRNGNYNYVGPTKQGIASFSINYTIKFN